MQPTITLGVHSKSNAFSRLPQENRFCPERCLPLPLVDANDSPPDLATRRRQSCQPILPKGARESLPTISCRKRNFLLAKAPRIGYTGKPYGTTTQKSRQAPSPRSLQASHRRSSRPSDEEVITPFGAMAERLGRGLQNLVQRFDSASHLHFKAAEPSLPGLFLYPR